METGVWPANERKKNTHEANTGKKNEENNKQTSK